jgi:hypothetical protein
MPQLIARLIRWIAGKLGLLVVIVAILLVVGWLRAAWVEHRQIQDALETDQRALASERGRLASLEAEIAAAQADWRRKTTDRVRALGRELDALDDGIRRFQEIAGPLLTRCGLLDAAAERTRTNADRARARLRRLQDESWFFDPYLRPLKAGELALAEKDYLASDRLADGAEARRDAAAASCRSARGDEARLQARRAALDAGIQDTDRAVSPEAQRLVGERQGTLSEIEERESAIAARERAIEQNPRQRLIAAIRANLPAALGILVGLLLLPVLMKAFLYFVLAPLAGRLAPVCILPQEGTLPDHGDGNRGTSPLQAPSGVSATLEIAPGEELLVQPDFLQSSSKPAIKRTRWFLNPRLPFASIASGMFALTSVKPEGGAPTRVVVSSQRDPFSEIGVIAIPQGAAMVVHPRALAGLLKPAGRPTHITRHWRLGTLHAWLTLQLRYLAFHGPCRLVMKGCRGVRSEAPQPGQPRLINQAATLGFSANLEYRTVRTETFVPYLRGHEDLFNDLFAGGPGWFVYEEMPARERRAGIAGRGLEGLADAFLKAFGI